MSLADIRIDYEVIQRALRKERELLLFAGIKYRDFAGEQPERETQICIGVEVVDDPFTADDAAVGSCLKMGLYGRYNEMI